MYRYPDKTLKILTDEQLAKLVDMDFKSLVEDNTFVPGEFEKGEDATKLSQDLADCHTSCEQKPVFKHGLANRLPRNVIDPDCTVEEPGELSQLLAQCTTVCEPQRLVETEYTEQEKKLIAFLERYMGDDYIATTTKQMINQYIDDVAKEEYRKHISMEFFTSGEYVKNSDGKEYCNEYDLIQVKDKVFKIAR